MRRLTLNLTKRKDGRVCKKIDGIYRVWNTEDEARAELLRMIDRRDKGMAGDVDAAPPHDPPLRVIANRFRDDRNRRGITPSTCRDYMNAVDEFFQVIDRRASASSLRPSDFARARAAWAKRVGPWKLDQRIQAIRTMFKWACETARMIDRVPWYGDAFSKTSAADKRRVAREKSHAHGDRVFSTDELRTILASPLCSIPLRAFVLLGINAGMYAADCSELRFADLKELAGIRYVDNDRIKTGIRRKFVLWKETAEAIDACAAVRPKRAEAMKDYVFITRYRDKWVKSVVHRSPTGLVEKSNSVDSINLLLGRLLRTEGIKRPGLGFGALRHTHVSAVADHPDTNARHVVRGHKIYGIESHYDFPSLERLKAVSDLAYERLYVPATTARRRRKPVKRQTALRRPSPPEPKTASRPA